MTTFKELHEKYVVVSHREKIFNHLLELLQADFMGDKPKKYLLDKLGVAVPQAAFEDVYGKLIEELQKAEEELKTIQDTAMGAGLSDGRVIDQE